MANWEYKVITSGKGGFASPALLEKFLNDLGRDEWEIVEFRSSPDNVLAFTGLARRSTQRDWTLEDAAAAAAKAEAEKLRAEFAAKFQSATASAPVSEERAPSFLEEKAAPDDGFRKPVDTSRDSEPDAVEEESGEKDEWDQLAAQDELPTFFDVLKPHMRRNQRGPGQSVGIDYLAKKWGLAEEDIKGALVECGLQIPADENAKPVYVEFEGDLFWVNINRRGEVWINTREKPRPVFRVVQGTKVENTEEEKAENGGQKEGRGQKSDNRGVRSEGKHEKTEAVRHAHDETSAQQPEVPPPAEAAATGAALPEGAALLAKIKPLMRRNRRGPGGSGSGSFLARALKCSEADLKTSFAALGLKLPESPNDKPAEVEINNEIWWLNQDSRGGLWINGREKRASDVAKAAAAETTPTDSKSAESAATGAAPAAMPRANAEPESVTSASTPSAEVAVQDATTASSAPSEDSKPETKAENSSVLSQIRPLLKETRTGSFAGKLDHVANELTRPADELTNALTAAGLKVPEKAREKPVFVEQAGEIFWFNLNAKGELWVNAKASKFADKAEDEASESGEKKPRRGARGRSRAPRGDAETPAAEPTSEPGDVSPDPSES